MIEHILWGTPRGPTGLVVQISGANRFGIKRKGAKKPEVKRVLGCNVFWWNMLCCQKSFGLKNQRVTCYGGSRWEAARTQVEQIGETLRGDLRSSAMTRQGAESALE